MSLYLHATYTIDDFHFEIVDWDTSFGDEFQEHARLSGSKLFHELHMATIIPMGQERTHKRPGLEEFRTAVKAASFGAAKGEKLLIYSVNDEVLRAVDDFLAKAEAQYLCEDIGWEDLH